MKVDGNSYLAKEIIVPDAGQIKYRVVVAGNEIEAEIALSALKHGKTVEDILSALEHCIYDETIVAEPNKTLVVGFDVATNLTEVISHVLSEEEIVVFHAMPCRKKYLEKAMAR